jgi:hypothetical protein
MRAVRIHETLILVSASLALALCIFAFSGAEEFLAQLRKLILLTGRSPLVLT